MTPKSSLLGVFAPVNETEMEVESYKNLNQKSKTPSFPSFQGWSCRTNNALKEKSEGKEPYWCVRHCMYKLF